MLAGGEGRGDAAGRVAALEPWAAELRDFVRAFSGAFLFGMPLLFTMEMWWIGTYADLWKLVAFLAFAFVINLHLNYYAGFKRGASAGGVLNQAIDATAVGIVASLIVLLALGRIGWDDPLDSILGKVIIQAVPLSIGASVANAVFSGERGREGGEEARQVSPRHAVLNDIGATAAGAIFIGFSIAPTEEVPMLAAEMGYWHEVATVALTLVMTYAIVFASGFDTPFVSTTGTHGPWQQPLTETTLAYVISLLVALTALYFFNALEVGDPLSEVVSQVLVLGVPAAVGGAAGRLVI